MKQPLQSGFTLMEVLLTMVILGVGMIGICSVELSILRQARQTAQQEFALRLALELADLLRLYQRSGAAALPGLTSLDQAAGSEAAAAPTCFHSGCTPAALAGAEVSALLRRLEQGLPQARVRICRDRAPWNAAAQTYVWECSAGGGAVASSQEPLAIKIGWRDPRGKDGNAAADAAPRIVLSVFGGAT